MTERIAMFNHKGGVSKTTTTFHLGWMLASKGHRVILVDADPQCNLSGLILGFKGENEFEHFYEVEGTRNIRAGLAPAFESQPRSIEPVDCVEVPGREGLFLLPGHIRLSEYEVTLGIAQELAGSIQTLQNLPGSFSYLLDVTAQKYRADYVLVDMNPSLSSINQNLLMTSDFFIVPSSPDYFSVMAIESLSTVIPRWHAWSERAKLNPTLRGAAYPYPDRTPKFLGTVIQKYRPRKGAPTEGFQSWIDSINDRVARQLAPTLNPLKMLLPPMVYARVAGLLPGYCLAQIADFNTLIAKSQEHKTPVFALTDAQLGHVGVVLGIDQGKREEFKDVFSNLASQVETLTTNEIGA
jgi:cellulose biosynthesis protein BcsQ